MTEMANVNGSEGRPAIPLCPTHNTAIGDVAMLPRWTAECAREGDTGIDLCFSKGSDCLPCDVSDGECAKGTRGVLNRSEDGVNADIHSCALRRQSEG